MEAQVFRARAELCRQLLTTAKRLDVRWSLHALLREFDERAAAAEFQARACRDFPKSKITD
jgi:hypothetical protein